VVAERDKPTEVQDMRNKNSIVHPPRAGMNEWLLLPTSALARGVSGYGHLRKNLWLEGKRIVRILLSSSLS
jgi:hypothetical protein